MSDLRDQIAVIVGSSSGMGRAAAVSYAEQGAKVVLAARSVDKLEELRKREVVSGGDDESSRVCNGTRARQRSTTLIVRQRRGPGRALRTSDRRLSLNAAPARLPATNAAPLAALPLRRWRGQHRGIRPAL